MSVDCIISAKACLLAMIFLQLNVATPIFLSVLLGTVTLSSVQVLRFVGGSYVSVDVVKALYLHTHTM